MQSKFYTVCWDSSYENCLDITNQLDNSETDFVVYNVSEYPSNHPNWVDADDVRYYGHFYNALKDFKESDKSIFVFNAGDAKYDNHSRYIEKVEALFEEDRNVYVFAPSLTNDEFTGPGGYIKESEKYKDYYLSTHTNGIYVFLRKEVAHYLCDFLDWATKNDELNLKEMKSGWGLDTSYASYAIYLGKKIYRDKLIMEHPAGSTYHHANAFLEMNWFIEKFRKYCELNGFNGNKLQRIYDVIYQKAREHTKFKLEHIYINTKNFTED